MKYFITTTYIILVMVAIGLPIYLTRDRVRQSVHEDEYEMLCPSGVCLWTYVWCNGEIIESWHDDINIVTDSLVAARKQQGEELLKGLP